VNNALMFGTGNNATGTPHDFFIEMYEAAGGFGCDLAADKLLTLVPDCWYGPDHDDPARRDCLSVDWPTDKPNWMNPPYAEPEQPCPHRRIGGEVDFSRCKKKRCVKRGWHTEVYIPGCIDFVRKAEEQRRRGAETWALVASRTDVEWFHDFIWDQYASVWRSGRHGTFLRGRLTFRRNGKPDPAPFPSLLVVFRP
jgi:hypothetical protein